MLKHAAKILYSSGLCLKLWSAEAFNFIMQRITKNYICLFLFLERRYWATPVYISFFLKSAFWRARLEIAIRKRCFLRSSIYQRCMCSAMLWVAKHLFSGACAYTRLHDFFQLQAWVRHYTLNHIKQVHSSKLS